jgi:predicted HTH domain antitoxin
MEVRIQIPDDIAAQIQTNGGDLPRSVLEAYALEGYKSGKLSTHQVQEILGFETPMEVDGFLKRHGIYLDYTEQDLEEDTAISRRISSQLRDK